MATSHEVHGRLATVLTEAHNQLQVYGRLGDESLHLLKIQRAIAVGVCACESISVQAKLRVAQAVILRAAPDAIHCRDELVGELTARLASCRGEELRSRQLFARIGTRGWVRDRHEFKGRNRFIAVEVDLAKHMRRGAEILSAELAIAIGVEFLKEGSRRFAGGIS